MLSGPSSRPLSEAFAGGDDTAPMEPLYQVRPGRGRDAGGGRDVDETAALAGSRNTGVA